MPTLSAMRNPYSRFPKYHRAFLGRDSGTLKSDIVSKKTSTMNLFGFETLKLKIRRLKLWKPTVSVCSVRSGRGGGRGSASPEVIHMCVHTYIYMYTYIYTYIYICIYIYIHIYIYMYVCMCVCVYVCRCVGVYVCM